APNSRNDGLRIRFHFRIFEGMFIQGQRWLQLCVCSAMLAGSGAFGQSYTAQTVAGTTRFKDGAPAINTPLRYPWGVVQDGAGNIYVADNYDNRIFKIGTDGNIHAIAGTGQPGFSGDGGSALKARFFSPRGLCLDGKGGLYVSDYDNNRI